MNKRNKKHNPLRMLTLENEKSLKNVAVSYFVNDNDIKQQPEPINLQGELLKVTKKLADSLQLYPYKWSVMLCVFCVEKGLSTIKMEIAELEQKNRREYQRNIVADLNVKHQAFVAKLKALNVNVSGVGWIASPVGRDFDEEEVGRIFEKLSAF